MRPAIGSRLLLLGMAAFAAVLILGACARSDETTDPQPVAPSPEGANGFSTVPQPVAPSPEGPNGFSPYLSAIWRTDFSRASVTREDFDDVINKDQIPAIDDPRFLPVGEVDFLREREPVIAFQEGAHARAYPIHILMWHEIINDVVDGRPVLITFCPLCNTAIAFDRTADGKELTFGVSGFLRNSDLVMFDRDTESWWQQATGKAIVGTFLGEELELLPSTIVAWGDFKAAFPEGLVLSQDTGYRRAYGANPYVGYDDINSSPFRFNGVPDGRLSAMERVVGVSIAGEAAAYPMSLLKGYPVVTDTVGGTEIVIFFKSGTASALDEGWIELSRDVGSAAVFRPFVDGRRLTFRGTASDFVDNETGSRWDIFGRATAGPLKGKALEPVISGNHFWFAWAVFEPETRVWSP